MITKTAGLWDLSRSEIILGKYQIGQAVHLGDPTFLQSAQDYRRMAAARMVAIEPSELRIRFRKVATMLAAKWMVSLPFFAIAMVNSSQSILAEPFDPDFLGKIKPNRFSKKQMFARQCWLVNFMVTLQTVAARGFTIFSASYDNLVAKANSIRSLSQSLMSYR